jgi:hypothetical protein
MTWRRPAWRLARRRADRVAPQEANPTHSSLVYVLCVGATTPSRRALVYAGETR